MADADGLKEADNYGLDIPVSTQSYYLKGLEYADWGIKDRMSRIFNKKSGKTVMLAFDHGYIMGPTSGLEAPPGSRSTKRKSTTRKRYRSSRPC